MGARKKDFAEYIENVNQKLLSCEYEQARESLSEIVAVDDLEKRQLEHCLAKIFMYQECYENARALIQETIDSFGPNLNLLVDLASCYYFLGRYEDWKRMIQVVQAELEQSQEALSLITYVESKYILAQYFEMLGELQPALEIYQEIEKQEGLSSKKRLQCLANMIRILSLGGSVNGLGALYTALTEVEADIYDMDLYMDAQHGLVLAETILVGKQIAQKRLLKLLEDKRIPKQYRSLFLFDYFDLTLITDKTPNFILEAMSFIKEVGTNNLFEKNLKAILQEIKNGKKKIDSAHWDIELDKMPLASRFRLLSILIKYEKDLDTKASYIKRAKLLLDCLGTKSKALWQTRFHFLKQNQVKEIICNQSKQDLCFQENHIKLSSQKSVMWRLLTSLTEQTEIDAETAMQKVWQSHYNESFYNKARVSVIRLNKILFAISGEKNCIKVRKDKICLQENIKITLE